jgi:Mn2+/Fe2+ NRAMP family transporter
MFDQLALYTGYVCLIVFGIASLTFSLGLVVNATWRRMKDIYGFAQLQRAWRKYQKEKKDEVK